MNRRSTIRAMLAGSFAALAAPVVIAVTRYVAPLRRPAPPVALGKEEGFGEGSARDFTIGERQGIVVRTGSGELLALDLTCTHAGCSVHRSGNELICPCHEGRFALDGSVISGPPPAPLRRLRLERRGGSVIVHDELL